jgi:glycosyltransferase involved in cell wall biosynthesis
VSLKIIQILHHSPSWTSTNVENDIFDGWHVRTAKAIQKLSMKNCQIECWLPEKTYRKEERFEKDGLIYRIFPSFPINYGREISLSMLKAIKQASSIPVLLHIHGIFNYTTYLIAKRFGYLPIVAQHHGDCPPLNLLQRRNLLYIILPLLQIEQSIFCKVLNNIDYFFCLTKTCQQSLNYLGIKNKSQMQGMGVDFNIFSPGSKDKARRKLNLPLDTKIMLQVGKLNRYKGGDRLIKVFKNLKEKYNIICIAVGASSSDELFNQAKESGMIIFSRQPHDNLNLFYRAADVYVYPGNKVHDKWSGIGISTIEAIGCNLPVVSPTLIHFPDDNRKIGFCTDNTEEIVKYVEYIFQHPEQYKNIREHARQYYDWQNISDQTYKIYQQLFEKYYKVKLEKNG